MSYFVWNKIDHAVVHGNDKKRGNDGRDWIQTCEGMMEVFEMTKD